MHHDFLRNAQRLFVVRGNNKQKIYGVKKMSHDNIPEKCGKYMKYLPIYDDKFEENYDEMKQQSFFYYY